MRDIACRVQISNHGDAVGPRSNHRTGTIKRDAADGNQRFCEAAFDLGKPVKPWAVAVMIGPELYLFDAELGLPLPGPERRGVANFSALVKQPEVLEQMNIDAKQTYWVKPADLESLRLWISASPEELSKRMWLLDRESKGAKHLALFVDADALAKRLNQSPQLRGTKVSLWRVPESRGSARRIDWVGALFATLGLGGLVFGFVESSMLGWKNVFVLAGLIAGFVFLVLFVLTEQRVVEPMMPLRLFSSRDVTDSWWPSTKCSAPNASSVSHSPNAVSAS